MKQRIAFLFAPVLFLALVQVPFTWAGDDVEQQLKSDYLDKVLTLRHFYTGNRLVFQPDGSVQGMPTVGPWTVDGQISVKSIKVRDHALRIHGRRVCLVFDSKAKTFRDVLNLLEESNAQDRDKLAKFFRAKDVEIEVALVSEKPDLQEASSAMNAVFLTPGEPMGDLVPSFWRDYFDQIEGKPRRARDSTDPVYSVKRGEVSAPRTTYAPSPQFSEEARQAKYQGTMTLSLVVDASGAARDIRIVSPLGLGLDEKAVESVSTWKFEPGKKGGNPVSVKIMVEVDFHLY